MTDTGLPDYTLIPDHCRAGMKRYIEDGVIPGDFLQAVICNKLVQAYGKADDTNIRRMFDYAKFLYNEAPSPCWGSHAKMKSWSEWTKARKAKESARQTEGATNATNQERHSSERRTRMVKDIHRKKR